MKKKIRMTMAILSFFVLVGCGNQQEPAEAPTTTEKQAETVTAEPTSAPTEMPVAEPTSAPTETPVAEPTSIPTEVPTSVPTEAPHSHQYGDYVYNNDATYTADGTETATCDCGMTDTRVVSGSKLEYTFTELDQIMYAKSSVNVRDLPSADGNKLGALSQAQEVHITGQCIETNWYRVEYNGGVGYVSDGYIVVDKPVEEAPAPSQTDNATNTPNSAETEVCPYQLYVIYYDNQGYPYFYGKWGGSANMDADNWAKTDACMRQMDNYVHENHKVVNADGSWSSSSSTSWQFIGTYQGMQVVVRYIDSCNYVAIGTPESRGIPTAGNGIW